MSFFNEVTMSNPKATTGMNMGQKFNVMGQQMFAGNYAKGGMASYMFSPGGRRPGGLFFGGAAEGGSRHIARLEKMRGSGLYNEKSIDKALEKAKNVHSGGGPKKAWGELGKVGKVGRVGSKAMGVVGNVPAMALISGVAMGAMTEGSAGDKATAGVAGAVSMVGWEVGSKAGMAAGAAIGSVVPVVGTAIGAVAGYIVSGLAGAWASEEGVHGIKGMMDKRVDLARKQKRASGWYGDTSAFDTQKAATMRQMSLQAMNSGMMSARSGLGHEGVMVHQ